MLSLRLSLAVSLILAASAPLVHAQERVLNLYSSRHYQTDQALYDNFTKQTGIKDELDRRR